MPNDTLVRARVDEHLKYEATQVLSQMGLSLSDAIRIMLTRIVEDKALPFEMKCPNATTLAAFEASDRGEDLIRCTDTTDLFQKLGL